MNSSERRARALADSLLGVWQTRSVASEMRATWRTAISRVLRPFLVACFLCFAASAALGNSDRPTRTTGNWLLGQWAREAEACRQPEFTFQAETAMIFLEADGEPTSFIYPAVSYEISGPNITVSFGKRHPMAKTPGKTELRFQLTQDGLALLQLLKGREIPYVRCLSPESN